MKRIRSLASGIWDFIVGDDWVTALGVVVALAVTAVIADNTEISAWWITPIIVAVLLATSVRRAAR